MKIRTERIEKKTSAKPKKGVLLLLVLLCFCTGLLFGCSQGTVLPESRRSEKGYSAAQIRMIASTEKNRYEALCTEEIWQAEVGEQRESFEHYLKTQLQSFMDEMKVMNLLAAERDISLTPQEQTAMAEASEEYYQALSDKDIARMELSLEEVQALYADYCLAEKLVTELTGALSLEVSDSEAKVITILQAEAKGEEAAEAFLTAVLAEGADFERCAAERGLLVTERKLGRKEEGADYELAVFSLETGEISSVIAENGAYYVVKCLNSYDREATAERKERIYEGRRQKAFRDLYDSYREDIRIVYSGDPFEKLEMKSERCEAAADFFAIYETHAD